MNHNLNNEIKEQLTQAIKENAWDKLTSLRNNEGDPGSVFYIDSLDLANRDLGAIPTDFLVFRNCDLSNSSFAGKHFFPMAFWSCKAQNLDLRNTEGMLFAYHTDLRGAKFDETTQLVVENSDLPSAFKNCLLDEDFAQFLVSQGALLDFPRDKHIESYAFGVTDLGNKQ